MRKRQLVPYLGGETRPDPNPGRVWAAAAKQGVMARLPKNKYILRWHARNEVKMKSIRESVIPNRFSSSFNEFSGRHFVT